MAKKMRGGVGAPVCAPVRTPLRDTVAATLDGIDRGPFRESGLSAVGFVPGDFLLKVF